MLAEFASKRIVPDLILFADTGGEKPETCAYLPVIQEFLKEVEFPPVVTVRYGPKTVPYRTSGYNQPLKARPRGKVSGGGADEADAILPRLSIAECCTTR